MAITNTNNNSRLLNNTKNYRDFLFSRNLYNLDREYPLKNSSNAIKSINNILNVIPQYRSLNLTNSLISRVAGIGTSPLTEIGTVMLGKQMLYNSASHIAQKNLPVINIGNLFNTDKNKHVFTKNIDYTITVKKSDDLLDSIGNFVSNVFFNTNSIGSSYPFDSNSNSDTYLKNTGTGQLNFLYQALNQNIYKENNPNLIKYGEIADNPIQPRKNITKNKIYFKYSDFSNYISITSNAGFMTDDITITNNNMSSSYSKISTSYSGQEYSSTLINDFGITSKNSKKNVLTWVDNNDDIIDDVENKLVWGRDGLQGSAEKTLASLHGNTKEEENNLSKKQNINKFGIKGGLLEYTRNLLNASSGVFVDITRKVFKNGDNIVGFNGSPLWQSNNLTYSQKSGTVDKTGIRQHTILDPYDKFIKAIRFQGNKVYEGNPDSVIYKTVMPKIHPTLPLDDNFNNKNMMFSIENLAVEAIKNPNGLSGIINDEWGSSIPLSEIGPFNGRVMWFPPYNLQVNETASAKYESTVMVGRNEPMYNYINSERATTLTFTLLIDYPEQLRNYVGENKNKEIADFFVFGGDKYFDNLVEIENLEKKLKNLENQLIITTGTTKMEEPPKEITNTPVYVFFPNDMPNVSDVNTIIDKIYKNPYHYEIIDGCESGTDGNGYGLNKDIYFIAGLVQNDDKTYYLDSGLLPSDFSQYNMSGITGQFGITCLLNKQLKDTFSNTDNCKYYDIFINGRTSQLGGYEYNKELGDRRISATQKLIDSRLKAIFGKGITELGINVIGDNSSLGGLGSSQTGISSAKVNDKEVKEDRYAVIYIKRNGKSIEPKKQELNKNEQNDKDKTQNEIDAVTKQINKLKYNQDIKVFNQRLDSDTAILNGFKSVSKNYYYPVFHSQTPEDFHRRLTFLQQCTRQGAAKRYNIVDEKGNIRAKNSTFGRQPICILRVGDFFYTKVIIENVTIDYNDTTWDMNPEGFGMQPMIANVTLQMKVMGGQSLKGPIDALQNAVSSHYYANSTYSDGVMYKTANAIADNQDSYMKGKDIGILTIERNELTNYYKENGNTNIIINDTAK